MKYNKRKSETITRALNIIAEKVAKDDEPLSNPATTVTLLKLLFATFDEAREHFMVLFLDSQHRLIKHEVLFMGTLENAAIYPREVVRKALQYNAAATIFAHNHPSGRAEPSAADRRITQHLTKGLNLMDIRVLDHIIVAGNDSYSFADNGEMYI